MPDPVTIAIRRAQGSDTTAVASLLGELEHPSSEAFVRHELTRPSSQETLIQLVAEDGGESIGFLSLGIAEPFYQAPPFARIRALCVSATHRGSGIGTRLVRKAERLALQNGCRHIEVSSHIRRLSAHRFYRQQGYAEHHRLFEKSLTPTASADNDSLSPELCELLVTATEAANAAGGIQRSHFGHHHGITSQYAHDLKLETDKECENAIIQRIRSTFPNHSITAEESGIAEGSAPYNWIIDPLDGTVNFYHGISHFCTSIACYRQHKPNREPTGRLTDLGEPILGIVYDPISSHRYIGIRGRGATLNGAPLQQITPEPLERSTLTMALGSHEATMQKMTNIQSCLLRRARKIRVLGASALDLCLAARGVTGGHLQARINAWDFAAAGIILEECGGRIHIRESEPGIWQLVACHEKTSGPLREIMRIGATPND